jgi:iron complex transport system substrate-binding protein
MNLVSLNPRVTEIVFHLGAVEQVVGVSHLCPLPSVDLLPSVVTSATPNNSSGSLEADRLSSGLAPYKVDLEALKKLRPALIICSCESEEPQVFCQWAENYLTRAWERSVRVRSINLTSLESVFAAYAEIGSLIGKGPEGQDLAQRMKSQVLDWGKNLYERLRNKKVTVVSSITPLEVAGQWIPDMVKLVSGRPYPSEGDKVSVATTWQEIAAFRPDVILIAPRGFSLEQSVRSLRAFEDIPEWDSLPAVKRGEVIFAAGSSLYSLGASFLEGVAVLISAMGALESGYITKRDEFYRLRFVELHRHRFL